ncbi:DUF2273 domain-containing protein [Liquorilactobacillus capillatus]|uniref:Small integral membrane protein n=1 Tax=Liquorilactobacillus capillatus DSM 19910 TaxID=1423731 RepID=A0A0R1M0C9_9LACO|nr:DUF2273 domain-containing protein [Liquorilactobacillus capillatus]KRL01280.1 hypothetical protein FC81_GL001422 [Liquorilactobacillus capillatus DSM 19910]
MKLSYIGALLGFLVTFSWIFFGFWKMVLILAAILIGSALGAWLDLQGITLKGMLIKLLDKLTN